MELKPGMWVLLLNDMRSAHIEGIQPALCGESPEEIVEAMRAERESWQDGHWGKTFRKGSLLEWFNYPLSDDIQYLIDGSYSSLMIQWFPPTCLHVSDLQNEPLG